MKIKKHTCDGSLKTTARLFGVPPVTSRLIFLS